MRLTERGTQMAAKYIVALQIVVLSGCAEGPRGETIEVADRTLEPGSRYASFDVYWPNSDAAKIALDAQRAAEIMTGRALPREAFAELAKPSANGVVTAEVTQDIFVKVYKQRNELRISNVLLQNDKHSGGTDIQEPQARSILKATLEALASAGIIDPGKYDLNKARLGKTEFGEGTERGETASWVVSYNYTLNRVINGIEFLNAGVRVSVHRSGQISAIRVGGAEIASTPATEETDGLRERPLAGGRIFSANYDGAAMSRRFAELFPRATTEWGKLVYLLPHGNLDAPVVEPLHVLSFSTKYGEAVSRRRYVGFSLEEPGRAPVDLSETPDPNAVGDARK